MQMKIPYEYDNDLKFIKIWKCGVSKIFFFFL